ncbi:MAG: hypothetical protein LT105_01220 [Lentimicrobium sp.]|nr:hypothetical protein [Lentimicrobium sp.]
MKLAELKHKSTIRQRLWLLYNRNETIKVVKEKKCLGVPHSKSFTKDILCLKEEKWRAEKEATFA